MLSEMADVSQDALADVKSVLKVEFPITGLQDFGATTKTWTFNGKKYTIPSTCEYSSCSREIFRKENKL
jgi:hypothetical protein